MKEPLTDLQFDILDSIYFVEPLENILDEVDEARPVVLDELKQMIDKGWIQVMAYDEEAGDYLRTNIFDSDNLQEYRFLATKEGLLRHNGH
ncbi:MAG: hypothetical protein MRZ79_16295 [Bacteroidia bacterium]|nr:hypothetical protein [Bacteroidia bacterium]